MPQRDDVIDLAPVGLTGGEGRRMEWEAGLDPLTIWSQEYQPTSPVPVVVDLSRMVSGGWALRLRFSTAINGACMRCLQPAHREAHVDAREVHDGRAGDPELTSPYIDGDRLNLHAWARDALVLALPAQIVCKDDCAGLCAVCGADLNKVGPEHVHESAPDPRWDKLRELNLE